MADIHYNQAIASRLRVFVDGKQWSALVTYLDGLSNAQFRTAGYMLGEMFLPRLEEDDFWQVAIILVEKNSKAFLVTLLKSWALGKCCNDSKILTKKISSQTNPIDYSPRDLYCGKSFFNLLQLNPEDVRKTLLFLFPVIKKPEDILWLISQVKLECPQERLTLLMQSPTICSGFIILQTLRELEDNRSLLLRTTYALMKRGDGLSFNLASLIRAFFGLDEVKGTFSLRLQPYELHRLSSDYAAFKTAMNL